jgi:hypothetical protein
MKGLRHSILDCPNRFGSLLAMNPIIPIIRREPFDDPAFLLEIKLDGFRALADTLAGRLLSKNDNALKRFASVLDTLPTRRWRCCSR